MRNKIFLNSLIFLGALNFSSCLLQTRSEAGAQNQSQIYKKKNIENQQAESAEVSVKVDEKDELIRSLNGRLETLENQLQILQKEKLENKESAHSDAQKIQILQDSLAKLENQITRLEQEKQTSVSAKPAGMESSDDKLTKKGPSEAHDNKKTGFEIGEELFKKKDFKKAILSYQQ